MKRILLLMVLVASINVAYSQIRDKFFGSYLGYSSPNDVTTVLNSRNIKFNVESRGSMILLSINSDISCDDITWRSTYIWFYLGKFVKVEFCRARSSYEDMLSNYYNHKYPNYKIADQEWFDETTSISIHRSGITYQNIPLMRKYYDDHPNVRKFLFGY